MSDDYNDKGFSEYWRILTQYKILFFLIIGLSLFLSVLYAIYSTPFYRSSMVVIPAEHANQKGGLSSLAGQFGGIASLAGINLKGRLGNKETAIAMLKSRKFLSQFIKDSKVKPILFDTKWDEVNGKWKLGEVEPTTWQAFKLFRKLLEIVEDRKTGLIMLSIEWKDPILSAKWANDLIARLNAKMRLDAKNEIQRNMKYLKNQINTTSHVAILESLYGLLETEMKKIMLAEVNSEYVFKVIDPAYVPEERSRPKRRRIVFFGLLMGIVGGIFLIIFVNFFKEVRLKTL